MKKKVPCHFCHPAQFFVTEFWWWEKVTDILEGSGIINARKICLWFIQLLWVTEFPRCRYLNLGKVFWKSSATFVLVFSVFKHPLLAMVTDKVLSYWRGDLNPCGCFGGKIPLFWTRQMLSRRMKTCSLSSCDISCTALHWHFPGLKWNFHVPVQISGLVLCLQKKSRNLLKKKLSFSAVLQIAWLVLQNTLWNTTLN